MSDAPLDRFNTGVAEVHVLLSLCSLPQTDTEKENAICRAAAVLLVSHFESFIKALTEDFMDSISGGGIESRSIPLGIKELHSLPRMEEILACQNQTQRSTLLQSQTKYACLWTPEAKPPQGLLRAGTLARKVTSAKTDVIDEVFTLMGAQAPVCDGDLDVIFDDDDFPTPVNIRLMIRDVVQCRNDIAHGDVDRIPTSADMGRYIRQLETFARRLDARAGQLAQSVVTP